MGIKDNQSRLIEDSCIRFIRRLWIYPEVSMCPNVLKDVHNLRIIGKCVGNKYIQN